MFNLIERLMIIYYIAKDIHYSASGLDFYSIHLLMDKISDGIYDKIDEIKEVYYLGNGTLPPTNKEIIESVAISLPEFDNYKDGINVLIDVLSGTIDHCKKLVEDLSESKSVQSIIDDICNSLMLKYGLLMRTNTY